MIFSQIKLLFINVNLSYSSLLSNYPLKDSNKEAISLIFWIGSKAMITCKEHNMEIIIIMINKSVLRIIAT